MSRWVRLATLDSSGLPQALTASLASLDLVNVYNPSVLLEGATLHVTFRAFCPRAASARAGAAPAIHGYYARCDAASGALVHQPIDLNDHVASYGITAVSDPKTFVLGGRVFATFNTGNSGPDMANDIYVIGLDPFLGSPQRCLLEGRQRIEKNWGFYALDGAPMAFYSVAPLVTLRLRSGELGRTGDLTFVPTVPGSLPGTAPTYSLGSQPTLDGDTLAVIVHEKRGFRGYRGYIGRLARISDWQGGEPIVELSPERLVHDLRSSIPRRGTHNHRMLFGTYFSGLTSTDEGLLTSYGINDVSCGFAYVTRG